MKAIDAAKAWWERISQKPWVAHLIRAGKRFTDRMGNQFGAALTYFSFLSVVPILMVSFAAAGFILASRPEMLNDLKDAANDAVPGGLFADAIEKAVESRVSIGVIGLVVAAYSGVGWISSVRDAVQAQWRPHWEKTAAEEKVNFFVRFGKDFLTLIGLGLALLVSMLLTTVGGSGKNLVLEIFDLQDIGWLSALMSVVPFILAVIGSTLMFLWFFKMMEIPDFTPAPKALLHGAIIAAVGFEILKVALTFILPKVTSSPTAAVFGPVIGLLFFFYLVARMILFVAAWIGTADRVPGIDDPRELPPVPGPPTHTPSGLNAAGASVVAGAAAAAGFVTGRAMAVRRLLSRRNSRV